MTFSVDPNATPYYDRMDLTLALACAREWIEEWDYSKDAHGYCHFRSILVRLVEAIEAPDED